MEAFRMRVWFMSPRPEVWSFFFSADSCVAFRSPCKSSQTTECDPWDRMPSLSLSPLLFRPLLASESLLSSFFVTLERLASLLGEGRIFSTDGDVLSNTMSSGSWVSIDAHSPSWQHAVGLHTQSRFSRNCLSKPPCWLLMHCYYKAGLPSYNEFGNCSKLALISIRCFVVAS